MGMIAVKDNLQTAMTDFARNLTSLHKEISSANMQGVTNFLVSSKIFLVFLKIIVCFILIILLFA